MGQDVFALDELAVTAQGGGLEAALADFYADAALTEAEAAQIDGRQPEARRGGEGARGARVSLNALHDHLERKLKEVEEHVSHPIAAVQAAEQLMDNRLQALEADAKRSVQDFSESYLHRHNWRGPFRVSLCSVRASPSSGTESTCTSSRRTPQRRLPTPLSEEIGMGAGRSAEGVGGGGLAA